MDQASHAFFVQGFDDAGACGSPLFRQSVRLACTEDLAHRRSDGPVIGQAAVRLVDEVGRHAGQLGQRHPGAAAAVVRPHRAVVHAYFELRDPKPLGAALIDLARRSLRRTLTRHG